MSKKHDLHVGDLIVASSGLVVFSGEIICGWDKRKNAFTEKHGAKCDPSEFIAVRLVGEQERVRIKPEAWACMSGEALCAEAA